MEYSRWAGGKPVTGRLLTTMEVAAFLSCSKATVEKLVAAGVFPAPARRGKRYLYREDDLARFLAIWQERRAPSKGWHILNGYVRVFVGRNHPMADRNGYVYEHRLVMSAELGRDLLPNEVVHHLNGVKDDNRPENLQLLTSHAEHTSLHRKKQVQRRA